MSGIGILGCPRGNLVVGHIESWNGKAWAAVGPLPGRQSERLIWEGLDSHWSHCLNGKTKTGLGKAWTAIGPTPTDSKTKAGVGKPWTVIGPTAMESIGQAGLVKPWTAIGPTAMDSKTKRKKLVLEGTERSLVPLPWAAKPTLDCESLGRSLVPLSWAAKQNLGLKATLWLGKSGRQLVPLSGLLNKSCKQKLAWESPGWPLVSLPRRQNKC